MPPRCFHNAVKTNGWISDLLSLLRQGRKFHPCQGIQPSSYLACSWGCYYTRICGVWRHFRGWDIGRQGYRARNSLIITLKPQIRIARWREWDWEPGSLSAGIWYWRRQERAGLSKSSTSL